MCYRLHYAFMSTGVLIPSSALSALRPQAKISAHDPACNSTTSVLAAPVDAIQGTTCTMVGKPLALPLSPVQIRESDTPSGYCSNPHVPTIMITPNATTPATGEPVSNSFMTKIRPGRSLTQSKCLMQLPSGAFSNITKPTSTCGNTGPLCYLPSGMCHITARCDAEGPLRPLRLSHEPSHPCCG
jgi:hypothetical protein